MPEPAKRPFSNARHKALLATPKPARSYFIMTRTGLFRPAEQTSNQCKEPGWPEYSYNLRMVFDGALKLDRNDFIVDHAQIDTMVRGLGLKGSCEDMTTRVLEALDAFMHERGIPMVACRCIIRATDPNAPAWLERVHVANGAHVEALRLLQ